MARNRQLEIGDIFLVELGQARYFQYIADDLTQSNSQVIRVFAESHRANATLSLDQMAKGAVQFYAHVFLRIGLKLNYWKKIGNSRELGCIDVLFWDSNDYGNPAIRVSQDWFVWTINGPTKKVGKLQGRYKDAEIGVVVPPDSIAHRIRTGHYDFVYPGY